MADLADIAQEQAEALQSLVGIKKKPTKPATGQCYNCDEPIKDGLFCDADCRHDWEIRNRGVGRGARS